MLVLGLGVFLTGRQDVTAVIDHSMPEGREIKGRLKCSRVWFRVRGLEIQQN